MFAISPSTPRETRSVFLLSYSSDRSHLTFRLDPPHTPSYDELKHAVLNEVIKQFHEKRYKSLDQGHDEQKSSVLTRRDGEKESIILEKDQERFLEFVGIQPDTAKTILEEHDRKLEKLRVSYNSLHQSLSFVVMVTFTHDVHISWITHAIGMACFEQNLTPAEINLLEVGSTARHQNFAGGYDLSVKEPDAFITPNNLYWPAVVVESGWSESRAHLEQDADLWLRGSQGQVRGVIVIKWTKVSHTKTARGDLKVLHLGDNEIRASQSEIIFPLPENHAFQVVQIPKSVLFQGTCPNLTNPTSNIPFPINALRESARRAMQKDGYSPA